MIANHIASLPEKWQRVNTTLRKVTSLFFRATEYPSEERYLRVLWSYLARFNNMKVCIISRPMVVLMLQCCVSLSVICI